MDFLILFTFAVAFISSILSGMAGVGGGFIMAPFWLLIGLTPAQAAANGSFMALGMGLSSLAAFKNSGHLTKDKKLLVALVSITIAAGAIGAYVLPYVETEGFKTVLGILTFAAIPLVFVKPKKLAQSKRYKVIGILLFSVLILCGSVIFSSVFSILIAIVLMNLFGQSVLQSTVLRRLISTIQVAVLFLMLGLSGNFVWMYAIAGLLGGVLGVYIGTKIAIKRGERFAKYALAVGATISAIALLI
ncbi:MAG: sulfite exporter TauE/SafE family protein [Candidatus Saccharimonadales bacterium]